MSHYETGYFGVPGKTAYGKVHVTDNRKPVCGAKQRKLAEFQVCGNGIHKSIVDCERCRKTLQVMGK